MLHFEGLIGRVLKAILYGLAVFAVIYIIGLILIQVPQAVSVGEFLKKWASIFGLLAGAVSFFTGNNRPV